MSSDDFAEVQPGRRYRPSRRAPQPREQGMPLLSPDMSGMALAYANTLLFVGYEVDGVVEVVVYPRYRFSSDDRVQGHLGRVWAPFGASLEEILSRVDQIYEAAQENYRLAVTLRSGELRAHGSRFETAYESITDVFRECWHGFALRLEREGRVVKGDMEFTGRAPGPVLVDWRGRRYTVYVFPTGSITMLDGDRRDVITPG